MWFRTALLLILFLLVFRLLRGLLNRMASGPVDSGASRDSSRPTVHPRSEERTTGKAGVAWPPGEITDVNYRETSTKESGTA